MIARALAQEPKLLLMDESTAFLDWPGKADTFSMLRELASIGGPAVIFASHDLEMALPVADEVWVLHDQKILHGTPEDILASGRLEEAFGVAAGTLPGHRQVITGEEEALKVQGPEYLQRLVRQALVREASRKPVTLSGIVVAEIADGRLALLYEREGIGRLSFRSVYELLQYIRKEG
jgi:iron complex transport system ATP-binding protein